jgi:hypothetical protein
LIIPQNPLTTEHGRVIHHNEFLLVFPLPADQDHGRYARLRTVDMDARAKNRETYHSNRCIPLNTEHHVGKSTLVNCAGVIFSKGVEE